LGNDPEPVDGFEFCMTMNRGMNMNMIKLPRRFAAVVDETTNQVLLRVCGGATGYWTMAVLFDRFGEMYNANGWKRFCRVHEIEDGHFLVFNYDGDHIITIIMFDESMCHHHYNAGAHYSSADDE
jgi:hypothetical protein